LSSIRRLDNEFKGLFQGGDDQDGNAGGSGRENGAGFMRQYGWIYQASIISEHEKIKLADVYELPTIQALNDLSYLKAKNAFDSDQMKKAYAKH
jgi:hypothetical protein